ncbi:MAG: hypothetical protein RLY87_1795 [Chloroflexota bacterium]|jgi:hypothetical protein
MGVYVHPESHTAYPNISKQKRADMIESARGNIVLTRRPAHAEHIN